MLRGPRGLIRTAPQRLARSADLDEGHADLRQGVAQRGPSGPTCRRAPPRGGEGVDGQGGGGRVGRRAGRWMARSSYSPMAWLMTTTSAGTSATRARASSIWARSAASSTSPRVLRASDPRRARSGRERSPPEPSGSRRSPTGCSPPGVQRLLTAANLPGTTELQAGSRRPVRRQPPPGHPSEAPRSPRSTVPWGRASGRCSRRSRRRRSLGSTTTATGGATSARCSASASSFPGRSSPLRE